MAREWRTAGAVEQLVTAHADEVYRVVSDVASTDERSTECRKVIWLDGAAEPIVGARFRGYNRFRLARWSRVCEILDAEPGRLFAFRTVPERRDPSRADSTTWRYELFPEGEHTRVRHSYEITVMPRPFFKRVYSVLLPHHRDMRPAMQHTLDRLAERFSAPIT